VTTNEQETVKKQMQLTAIVGHEIHFTGASQDEQAKGEDDFR
jgi:hypothetical protein